MPWPPLSLIHINIHNVAFQTNTLLNGGGRAIHQNTVNTYNHAPGSGTYADASNSAPASSHATQRRIEAQQRIRRKLEEVSTHPEGTSLHLGPVASLAMAILSVVELEDISRSMRLVDLAMDAHAVAYIAVISSLHRQQKMSKRITKKLIELLGMIHTFLVEAAATTNIVARLRKFTTRNRRKAQVMSMHDDLINLLRQIERNDDADILSSLNFALDYPQQ